MEETHESVHYCLMLTELICPMQSPSPSLADFLLPRTFSYFFFLFELDLYCRASLFHNHTEGSAVVWVQIRIVAGVLR